MKLKSLIVSSVFAVLCHFSATASEDTLIVEALKVEGLQRVAMGAALTYLPIKVGDEITRLK